MTQRFFPWIILCVISFFIHQPIHSEIFPKREFRGVWIPTVGNTRFQHMTPQQIQNEWSAMLDTFQRAGMNAVIFQVRPEADAFYQSKIEPWSRFLTGEQGKAPNPLWDPLAFMIKACHERNMQLHAWLNPYRVTINDHEELSKMNKKHHKLFIKYGKQLFFDPGNPESWKIVTKVVATLCHVMMWTEFILTTISILIQLKERNLMIMPHLENGVKKWDSKKMNSPCGVETTWTN